jgi:putative ABC transport system permease protein
MTLSYVLMQNLRRNPLRTALTAASFALPMAIFVAAISMLVTFAKAGANSEKGLRLAVRHKITLTNYLPERMRKEIEALDPDRRRILAICGFRWFGGRVENAPSVVQSLGVDADTFPEVFSDIELTPAEIEQWKRDRQAAVVGEYPASQYGWHAGQRIRLKSTVPPNLELDFNIVKIITAPGRKAAMYFRRDYFEESLKEQGINAPACNVFWVKTMDLAAMRSLPSEIDGLFANSPNETRTDDENAFAATFLQASGNVIGLMQTMAIVMVVIIALVSGNTMMMSFRERIRELAVFKALGFQNRRVFFIVLAESLALAVVGTTIGVAVVVPILLMAKSHPPPSFPVFLLGLFEVSWIAVAASFVIAALIGFLAGVWPAVQAMRLKPVSALRQVA